MGAAGWTRGCKKQDLGRFCNGFGSCLYQFLETKMLKKLFFLRLFPGHFSVYETKLQRSGFPKRGFRMESLAKLGFS